MKIKRIVQTVVAILILYSCNNKRIDKNFNSDFLLYKDYISEFTSELISTESDIRIVLSFNKTEWEPNEELNRDLISISPNVKGKIIALSENTISFIPEKKLNQNETYQVSLKLSKIIETPEELSTFNFTLKTIKQDFMIVLRDLQSYNKDYQFLNATVKFSDKIALESAKKIITATQDGKKLAVKFNTKSETTNEFALVIDSIQQKETNGKIEIFWDGKNVGIDQKGKIDYTILSKNTFEVIHVALADNENQMLLINFSNPIQKDQNFKGLISLSTINNIKYSVDGNLLKVFFETSLDGEYTLEIFQGIQNTEGKKLKKTYNQKISFEQIKPGIQFLKNGTILPSSGNLKINFEVASLKSVDVKIYKIYRNNILQFLQDNELNEGYNLVKVARPIAKKTINLLENNKSLNYNKWNAYALDLKDIISPEPGVIYRVELSYKKAYSIFRCPDITDNDTIETKNYDDTDDLENEKYDGGNAEYDYYDDYDWRKEKDPCDKSYYYYNAKIATNVLASDLGVIAKRGQNNSYFFAITDIVTTDPIQNAKIDLFTYQQQNIGSYKTNKDGFVSFILDANKKAYFAVITKGSNTTYIKLNDGLSQSVSNFDVSGNELQKGLKGYIYGERGVWRPGDTLFISFILNDIANKLPEKHPIKMKLTDPSGRIFKESVQQSNKKNHYKFVVPTLNNVPTGNWQATVSVGGVKFHKTLKIETIKPNRLKIQNSFAGQTIYSKSNVGTLQVAWLHGASARNLHTEVQAKFTQQKTTFKSFPKYTFDDPTRKFSTEEINVFSGKIDNEGKAKITFSPSLDREASGMLNTTFITKVHETGGDVSTDVVTATYSPYRTYVGIKSPEANKYGMLDTEKNNQFEVITVDEKGNPKPVHTLQVTVYKIEWRWWWNTSGDNLSDYNNSRSNTAYKSFVINTSQNGKGSFSFKVPEKDWGRYLIRVSDPNGGHATGQTVSIDWPIWSGKTKNENGSYANVLTFSTNKTKYNVGDKALISFPSSEGSRALISIENGTEIIESLWATTNKGETQIEIPITSKMTPNVYLYVTLIQPHASTLNDSPIRMYGITAIEVENKQTVLEPVISMPEIIKPEQKININVKEKSGKPMTYTIAIVDEGLLDLTRFKTPNAWSSFYAREALGVKTWDIYDNVIGAYGGTINQVFSIGGDEELGGGQAKKANRFKPVVIYLGPFSLDKNENKTHTVKIPKYVGSVRTMVVASDITTSAYGSTEKTTLVRNPLMILASLPRKISPSEKVTVPVTVFAMEKQIKNVTVQIKTNKGLRVIGSSTKSASFDQPDEKMVYFNLEAGDLTGLGKVEITAISDKEKTSYDVEVDIINPNPVSYDYKEVILEPNSTYSLSWETFGIKGSNKAKVEATSFFSIDFNKRLDYLISYPHGCLEQITSGVFPQLYINDFIEVDSYRKTEIQRNINVGIQKLADYQGSNGGFMYWPGDATPNDWATSYVGHFFIEAEKKGYVLPITSKKSWISYQQKMAKEWRYYEHDHNDLAQAYRLYTLALAGVPDLSLMNRLRETTGLSNDAKLRLAAAYALAGQKNAGTALLNQSKIAIDSEQDKYYYYGSSDRNRAMILETLIILGEKEKAFTVANKVAKRMSENTWMSTQTTAYCLYSISKFIIKNNEKDKGLDISYSYAGETKKVKTSKSFTDISLAIHDGTNKITLKNNKNAMAYIKVLNSGILPVGKEQTIKRNLNATIIFKDRQGRPIDVKSLSQGTEFMAEITITNTNLEYVENLALTQILPSGWEIVNTRYTDYGDTTNNTADYIDIRDDRIYFYFGLGKKSKTFTVLLHASYLGNYYLPGIQCEAMYNNSYSVRTKGQWVEVVK